jgi:glycosyltransferase involved in cell wall biosynthesis
MRIVHVADCYLPRLGGIELHVRDLAERQRAAGHEVTVVTRTPGEPAPGVHRVGPGERPALGEADVVHAHVSIVSPFALATARRAGYAGVPTLLTVHSLWSHVGPLPELARDLWGMARWPVTWSAVSERAALPVHERIGVPVHVVPNAVDLEHWTPAPALPPDTRPGTPPHVVSVMRLTSVKRALPLVRVLRQVARTADFSATIVGDGPERPAVERFLRRNRLTDRVELAGALDRSAIRRHLERASVFVAPAHRESFGIAALEARATGVPVLASAVSGVATFVEHGRDGLLAADDRELAAHLRTLVTDHDLRRRIAWHNRLVPPAHGWREALARTEELYAAAGARAGVRA